MKSIREIYNQMEPGKKIGMLLLILSLSSMQCKKFVDVGLPKTELVEASVFSNSESANSAVLGLYSRINQSLEYLSYGGAALYFGLSADEIRNSSPSTNYDAFATNTLLANSSTIEAFWNSSYSNIYHANAIIEGLSNSFIDDSLKNQFIAEAKLVRSFFYWYLLNIFGDIPLIQNTDYRINSGAARNSSEQVLQEIIKDLSEAELNLPAGYLDAINSPTTERIRPTKDAASALLARIYLYQSDWDKAETYATKVIANIGLFNIENDVATVFNKNSKEVIWQVMPVIDPFNSAEAILFVPFSSGSVPSFVLTPELHGAFDSTDKRKLFWLGSNTDGTSTYYYPKKFKVHFGWPAAEYNVILRLAEQYLIRAEARAQQNKLSEAASDLDVIRLRAGLDNINAPDKTTMLLEIEKERQKELFTEWGHRWFDLKRTGKSDEVLAPIKQPNWNSTDTLFPIPFNQIMLNANLTQNPGY